MGEYTYTVDAGALVAGILVAGTLVAGVLVAGMLLDRGVRLLEDGTLAMLWSSLGATWQAVSRSSSKTTVSRADKKRYFFIGSQPFTKIRKTSSLCLYYK